MGLNDRYAVIDIGSNTVRFNIYKQTSKSYKSIFNKKNFAGLRSYVVDNMMSEAGVSKLIKILSKFDKIISDLGVKEKYIFATASIRNIENSDYVLRKVKKETGLKVELLSGEQECYCDYLGVRDEVIVESGYIVDIGGGSAEIILIKDGGYYKGVSIPEGSLSLYTKFVSGVIPTGEECKTMINHVRKILKENEMAKLSTEDVYGIGGTVRACGNIVQEVYDKEDNKSADILQIKEIISKYIDGDQVVIKKSLQVTPERIHTQVPGMIILSELMMYYGLKNLTVCKNGVREGYLYYRRKD